MRKLLMILCGTVALVLAGICLIGLDAKPEPTVHADTPPAAPASPAAPAAPDDPRAKTVDALLAGMTLEDKVGQLFFARCPAGGEAEQAAQYRLGGYVLFARDFEGRTPDSLRDLLDEINQAADVPMLFGVDEEGGTVVRVSRYEQYRERKFSSPQALYKAGGMDAIAADAAEKAALLRDMGISINLAPVCDVCTAPGDFMYPRTFGKDATQTAQYVRTVVETTKKNGVGSVLKHFPGYGNNADTHTGIAIDERPLAEFTAQDFLPFAAGIEAGAGCVLVSHNVVKAFDADNPASLSPAVHRALRDTLGFTGVAMTDDLAMDAIADYVPMEEAAVRAIAAGNDLVISSDVTVQLPAVLAAAQDGTLSAARIDEAVRRVLSLKYDLGLLS